MGAGWFLVVSLALALTPLVVGLDGLGFGPADAQFWWSDRVAAGVEGKAARTEGRGPRVIFVGGSSVPFAVRARSLEERIGAPVLPYGLNAGLGIDLIARGAARLIRRGDIVVFAPELQHFRSEGTVNPALRSDWLVMRGMEGMEDPLGHAPLRQWTALRSRWSRYRGQVEWETYAAIVRAIARLKGDREWMQCPGPHGYETRYVDDDGNVTFPRPGPRSPEQWGAWYVLEVAPENYDFEGSIGVRTLEWLARVCAERGAMLMVMPSCHATPPWVGPEFLERVSQREEQWMRIADRLGATRLLEPGATAVGADGAFDSFQHLNDRGAAAIEERLAAALRGVVGEARASRE